MTSDDYDEPDGVTARAVTVIKDGGVNVPASDPPSDKPELMEKPDGKGHLFLYRDGYHTAYLDPLQEGTRHHQYDDVHSFAQCLLRSVDGSNADVLVQVNSIKCIHEPEREHPEVLWCHLVDHPAWVAWAQVFGTAMGQRKAQQLIRAWRGTIEDADGLLAMLSAVQVAGSTTMTSHIDEVGAVRLASSEGKQDISAKVPPMIYVEVPRFEGILLGSDECTYKLEVLVSVDPDPFSITLQCPTLQLKEHEARRDVRDYLEELLGQNWLVGLGQAGHNTRPVSG